MNKDLKLKKGDIVTYNGYQKNLQMSINVEQTIESFEKQYNVQVFKVERKTTIYEFKEILDKKEKEWLGNFIRPFREKVNNITKYANVSTKQEYLCIEIDKEKSIFLPMFRENTMYKGMKLNKEYTLEELDI